MSTETVNQFELAARRKLRFDSPVGILTVEDLWILPLTSTSANKPSLDALAVDLNRQLKGTEESFVSNTKKDATLKLKFDIVKYVIDTRIEENKAKTQATQRAAKLQEIEDLIASKKYDSLTSMSVEELEALKATI